VPGVAEVTAGAGVDSSFINKQHLMNLEGQERDNQKTSFACLPIEQASISTPPNMPRKLKKNALTVLEICAGAGGQALGLDRAGFHCVAAVELDKHAVSTLRLNRPNWNVVHGDVRSFNASSYKGVDLFAGGVPCPPFSKGGKQLGADDERDLFPEALRLIQQCKPRAVMLENVAGFADAKFDDYRAKLFRKLKKLGYESSWRIVQASDLGVPQLRPRVVITALRKKDAKKFVWKLPKVTAPTVGQCLLNLMNSRGWAGAQAWADKANKIAPTLVGGSKKHGGADLGPTRAKKQWAELGVDGMGIADAPPGLDSPFDHKPRLTVRMAARIQGFPDDWKFTGKKTSEYKQIGNAFPPQVAEFVGRAIRKAIQK
jgi:DNA (cytosine-5)-methyltransferase 1